MISRLFSAFMMVVTLTACTTTKEYNTDTVLKPLEQAVKVDDVSKYISSAEFIVLEEDSMSLLTYPDKVIRDTKGNFIIADSGIAHLFSNDGKSLGRVGALGRGPGEYMSVADVCFSNDMKEVAILNFINANIYDTENYDFQRRIEFSALNYDGIIPAENGGWYLVSTASTTVMNGDMVGKGVLYKFDSDGKGPVEQMIPAKDHIMNKYMTTQSYDGGWYMRPLDGENVLYKIKNGKVTAVCGIYFGDKQVPAGYVYNDGRLDYKRFIGSKYFKGIFQVHDTKDQLFFMVMGPKGNPNNFIYGPGMKSGIYWEDEIEDTMPTLFLASDETGFYVSFPDVKSFLDKAPEEMNPLTRYMVAEYKRQHIQGNDNPLLVRLEFDIPDEKR